jgi:hypothetical protein
VAKAPRAVKQGASNSDAGRPGPKKKAAGKAGRRKQRPARHHHNVYVIELDPYVLNFARFRAANPNRDMLKPCVYVGMTGLTPEARFAKHKAGIRANSYVHRFGLRLLPRLYAYANPMPYEAAREMEVELAIALQEEGYAVWQA